MNNVNLSIYEDGSLPELNIGKTIDQTPNDQKVNFINMCCKKLAYGGKIQLQGLHLDYFCKDYLFNQQVNLGAILQLNSITSLQEIQTLLQQNNIKIISTTIDNGLYSIEGLK